MLHEMLSGEAPFRAPTALGLLHRHIGEPPVPLRELRPEVPEPLEALVLHLLAKQPAERPTDVQQVYERLLPLLPASAGTPQPRYTALPDPTRPYRHPHQPHPAPSAGPEPAPQPRPVPTPVPRPVGAPEPEPDDKDLAAACAELSDLVAARRNAEVIDLAARLLPRAQAELGGDAPAVRTIRTIYAHTLLHERQYRAALPEYQLLAAAAEAEHGPHHPTVLDLRHKAASCLEHLGRGTEAVAEYQALLTAYSARLDTGLDTDPGRAFELRERIGLLTAASGDPSGAWQGLVQLLFDRERRLGPHHPEVRRLRESLDQLNAHRATGPVPTVDPRSSGWPTPAPLPGNPYATGA